MKSFKIYLLAALCIALLAGVYTLQNNTPPIVGTNHADEDGADKYEGKYDISNSPYFKQLDIYNMQSQGSLLLLPQFKTTQQITGYTCGPAAANMVVMHFLGKPLHGEMEIAEIMGTSSYTGTNTAGMCKYFKKLDWKVASSEDSETPKNYSAFLKFVQQHLQNNTPVIVENVDWGGHWRVIIGYDSMNTEYEGDDVLIMADPYDLADHMQDGYVIVPAEKFFYMWFDAQLFEKSKQKRQWLAASPK